MSAPTRDEGPQGVRVDQVGPETVEKLTRTRQAWREPPEAFEAGPAARAPGVVCACAGGVRASLCVSVCPRDVLTRPACRSSLSRCGRVSACVTVRVSPPVTPELGARACFFVSPSSRVTVGLHVPDPRGLCPRIRALGDLCLAWNLFSWVGVRYIIPRFLGVHLRGKAPQVCLPAWSRMVCVCLSVPACGGPCLGCL